MNQPIEIDVQDLDHLGLIAGIVDEIGIVDITNHLLGTLTGSIHSGQMKLD
jgi:hypothetical protein